MKENAENTFVISLANGEMQGYIATTEAVERGWYEGANAVFAPESGEPFVQKTLELLNGK